MFATALKKGISALAGGFILLSTFLLVCFCEDEFLLKGRKYEQSYYLYSASSLAKEVNKVKLLELAFVEGKSVRLEFEDDYEADEYAKSIVKEKSAQLQRAEFLDGVESYYYFVSEGGNCVLIAGRPVNLHIAVCGKVVSVGTPIIFGGY